MNHYDTQLADELHHGEQEQAEDKVVKESKH
jgi:hypothetical protein